ncbi:SDR family oxidoreductase [Sphingobium sp. Z007]|uniref:SDR family oxidoreductase n=1 Tax=Sphingobium sp. Z007 TaxID=627495 RepID=UPI000B49DA13|nr:SDR family oxidoreductase [Sphingobium sp. Z007]
MPSSPLFDLSGKVAIVTGGNGGLGLGMARGLAQAGAAIAIAARRADKAKAALVALESIGAKAIFIETDVADRASCFAMAQAVADQLGRIDILIANAGIGEGARPETMSEAMWRRTLDINLSGSFFSAQAVHSHMKASGGGKLVMLGSMTSIFGAAGAANYAASKGAVVQLAKSLAIAWARDNIQVNAILPGWLVTDMVADTKAKVPGFDEAIVARTPARRWGEPDDLAGTAVYLCSRASDFVTGAAIAVDGGYAVM